MRTSFLVLFLVLLAPTTALSADPCDEVLVPRSGPNFAALAECQRLAETGSPSSELQYGLLLFGRLPEEYQNRPEGIEWIRKSAEKGNLIARVAMAMFLSRTYEDSSNEFLDYVEAYAWYAVLDDKGNMKRVADKLTDEELAEAKVLAERYIAKYGKQKWTAE